MKRSLLSILFFSLVATQPFTEAECMQTHAIDVLLGSDEREFNGCVLVAQGENVLYEKCRGSYGEPALHHQFLVGSISKQFTSVVLLQLVDQKLVDLDQPIKKYLPDLPDPWADVVTIKHLLNHTSGVQKLGEQLEFPPGTQFKYSPTLAFYLCHQIAEKVTGCAFEQLLNQLFATADMKNTGVAHHNDFAALKQKFPLLVQGFKENNDQTVHAVHCVRDEEVSTWVAGGGIVSTVHDLLKWNLKLHQGNLLGKNSYAQMTTPSAIRAHPRWGNIGYGLGVQLVGQKDLEISHSGYIDGFISTLFYYPNTKISVIILENVSLERAFSFHDQLRDLIHSPSTK